MNTFISHSLADQDRYILNLLASKLSEVGLQLVSNPNPADWGLITQQTISQIQSSVLVIGLITQTGEIYKRGFVANEINFARQLNKPTILLIEQGVTVGGPLEDTPNTIYFNRQNIDSAIQEVRNRISVNPQQNPPAAAWLLGGLAVLALLKYLSDDKK